MKLTLPLDSDTVSQLNAGDIVTLSGEIFTARDAAHKRLAALLSEHKPLPFDLTNATIYYAGAITNAGKITSVGPTTSCRMDAFTPQLLQNGLKGMIGKGSRSAEVISAIKSVSAVYFAAVGGAGAFYAQHIVEATPVAFSELGSEAIVRLVVKDFPVVVAVDSKGKNIYNR